MQYNSAMNFEHLIQINDPENPLIDTARTASNCGRACSIASRIPSPSCPAWKPSPSSNDQADTNCCANSISAPAVIQDRVTLVDSALGALRHRALRSPCRRRPELLPSRNPNRASCSCASLIETTLANNPNSEDRAYIEYVKSAYHQSDVDCVRIIRTLAAGGQSLQ